MSKTLREALLASIAYHQDPPHYLAGDIPYWHEDAEKQIDAIIAEAYERGYSEAALAANPAPAGPPQSDDEPLSVRDVYMFEAGLDEGKRAATPAPALDVERWMEIVSDSLAATTEGTDWAEAPEPSDEPGSPYVRRLTNEILSRLAAAQQREGADVEYDDPFHDGSFAPHCKYCAARVAQQREGAGE